MTDSPASAPGGWRGHERGSGEYRRVMLAMFFAGVAIFAQLYAPQAVLPEISHAFGIDAPTSALMVSMATLGVAASVLPWSIVADRIGRVPAMGWSICLAVLFSLISVLMPSFELSLAARLLEGLSMGGVPAVAHAYLNEELHPKAAPAAAGVFVAGNTVGGMSGRLIAAPVGEAFGWQWGSLAVTGLGLASAIAFLALIPRSRGYAPDPERTVARLSADALRNVGRHLRTPRLMALYSVGLLLMGGFVAVYNYLGYRLTGEPYGLPTWIVGFVFLAYLAGTVSSPIAGRLAAAHGRKRTMLAACAVFVAGAALTLLEPLWAVIAGLLVLTAGLFGAHSVAAGWAGASATTGRAQSTALYNFGYYAGSSAFGYIGGLFFVGMGWPGLVLLVTLLALASAALVLAFLPWRPKGWQLGDPAP